MSDFHRILEAALGNPLLAATAQWAHTVICRAGKAQVSYGSGEVQSSAELAKTYAIRRSIGYFGNGRVHGLDETIEGLGMNDRPVYVLYAQIGTALISIWVECQSDTAAGLLVFESSQQSG